MNDQAPELTIDDVHRQAIATMDEHPHILSLLYDLDLMPEQVGEKGKREWRRMVIIAEYARMYGPHTEEKGMG